MRVLPVIKDAFVSVLGVSDMADILSLTEEVIDGVLHTLDQQAFGEFPIPDAPLVCLRVAHLVFAAGAGANMAMLKSYNKQKIMRFIARHESD